MSSISDLVEGLVREYLTKSGLTNTLSAFDAEQPRKATSVSSRTTLRKALALERLPAKLSKPPATPTLELWVQYQQQKLAATLSTTGSDTRTSTDATASTQHAHSTPPSNTACSHTSEEAAVQSGGLNTGVNSIAYIGQQHGAHEMQHQLRPNAATSTGKSAGPASIYDMTSMPHQNRAAAGQGIIRDDVSLQDVEDECTGLQMPVARAITDQPHSKSGANVHCNPGVPVPHTMMAELRQLMFGKEGSSSQLPWPAWQQGLFFSDRPGLQWGLVQRAGGPCGLLAAMQAHVVAALWGRSTQALPDRLTPHVQEAALLQALATVIWQASDRANATVIHSAHPQTASMSFDQLCRAAVQSSCHSQQEVQAAVSTHLAQYQEANGYGIVLLLMCVLASHTVRQTRLDMDESASCLIAAHGYCSQDLVNVMLTGHAVTNCFNGTQDVAGKLCKGVQQPSQLGFLSLFEWFGYTQVGSHLKSPGLPIWVVCSESHFTVVFALDAQHHQVPNFTSQQPFSLLYYDGLANQDQLIKLTLTRSLLVPSLQSSQVSEATDGKCLMPPLEHVIHTKWPDTLIDWNGSDPIL